MAMESAIDAAYQQVIRTISSPSWQDEFYWRVDKPKHLRADLNGLAKNLSDGDNSQRELVLARLRKIRPNHRLAVLAVVRNEALSLCEWIAHYKAIGVEWFFIYTNNNSDGTDSLLKWFSTWAPITPIFDAAELGVNTQFKAYEHALTLMPEIRLFDWLLIVDADEFLISSPKHDFNLSKQLADAPKDTDSILFPWLWRYWTPHFEYKNDLLSNRFPHGGGSDLMKSVSRLSNVISLQEVHHPKLNDMGIYRDLNMNMIPHDALKNSRKSLPYDAGWIDHFWGKSFEEFIVKKSRGDTMSLSTGHWKRSFSDYFEWGGVFDTSNFKPKPEPLVNRLRSELAHIQMKPGFEMVWNNIECYYGKYFSEIRLDQNLRQVFDLHTSACKA